VILSQQPFQLLFVLKQGTTTVVSGVAAISKISLRKKDSPPASKMKAVLDSHRMSNLFNRHTLIAFQDFFIPHRLR